MNDADQAGGGTEPGSGLGAAEAVWAEERQWFRRWLEGAMFARRSQETYLQRTGAFLRWLWSRGHEHDLRSAADRDRRSRRSWRSCATPRR